MNGAQLYVRDNTTGSVHKYGDNSNDCLVVHDDGSIHYINLQTMCGTEFRDEGYSFCFSDGGDPAIFGTDDAIIDIGGREVTREYHRDCIQPWADKPVTFLKEQKKNGVTKQKK